MRRLWQRFQDIVSPGVRVLLCIFGAACLTAAAGKLTGTFDLSDCLALSGPKFWTGQIWRLVTYTLLPAGILDFIFSSAALIMLGGMLERQWSRSELWLYCLITAIGTGLAKVILQFSDPQPLTGPAPIMMGLLLAWSFQFGREKKVVPQLGEVMVWKLALCAGAIGVISMALSGGLAQAIVMAAGGLTSLLYLWLRHRQMMSRPASVATAQRINHLEL